MFNEKFLDTKLDGNILFITSVVLSFLGCITIYSATVCKSIPVTHFLLKQISSVILGLLVCSISSSINYQFFKKITYPLYILTVVLLVAVLFFPKIKGAHRWIPIPFLGYFQPSELARVTSILLTAKLLDEYRSKIINGKKEFWILISAILLLCSLIFLQPDSGIPAITLCVSLLLLFISSVKIKYIVRVFLIGLILLSLSLFTKPFAKNRILSFFTKNYDKSSSYQITQSLYALSRGGMLGCGLGKGMFKEYYLPEIHTDFILCIIGEELGFIGSFIVICLFTIFAISGFSIAYRNFNIQTGFYGGILSMGLTLNIILQAYFNIAVVTKLFLPKGIGLPFISYGGSSTIINFLSVGMILSVWRNTNKIK